MAGANSIESVESVQTTTQLLTAEKEKQNRNTMQQKQRKSGKQHNKKAWARENEDITQSMNWVSHSTPNTV